MCSSDLVIQYTSIGLNGVIESLAPYYNSDILNTTTGATIASTLCISQLGGVFFKSLPAIFFSDFGFTTDIIVNMDDYLNTNYFINADTFVAKTSDAQIPLNNGSVDPYVFNALPNYMISEGGTVYIQYSGNRPLVAKNQFKSSYSKGHYLLKLSTISAYPQFQSTSEIFSIYNIVSTYYLSNNSYLSTNLLTSPQYVHLGENKLITSIRAEVVDPDDVNTPIDCGSQNYCYVEIINPLIERPMITNKTETEKEKSEHTEINELVKKQQQMSLFTK